MIELPISRCARRLTEAKKNSFRIWVMLKIYPSLMIPKFPFYKLSLGSS